MTTDHGVENRSSETADADGGPGLVTNAVIGAVITVVTAFVPFSPVLGGGVAGYLQRGSDREGLRVGALSGVIASLPILAIVGLVTAVGFFGIALTGEVALPLAVGAVLFLVSLFVIGYTVVLSTIGGFAGAAIAASLAGPDEGVAMGEER